MMTRSRKPAKMFIKSLLRRHLKGSDGHDVGVDIACGYMSLRRLFRTKKYIGIDMDADRIECGMKRYPEVTGIVSSIETIDKGIKGDFVVCVQVIGINKYFDSARTMECIKKIVDVVNPGGALILNVGPRSKYCEGEIDDCLNRSFGYVHKTLYGAFYRKTNYFVSLITAGLMHIFPWIRTGSKRCCYWMCRQRQACD